MPAYKSAASGRKVGTPNRRTKDAAAILKKHKFCPLTGMIEVAKTAQERDDMALYAMACKELIQYVYPKRKAVEHVNADGDGLPTQVIITITDNPAPMGVELVDSSEIEPEPSTFQPTELA